MMLLLDTCTFIWLTQEPEKLSSVAQVAINDSSNSLVFSHASAWEMHLKHNAGKLILPELPIRFGAIQRTSDLPDIHRDPFDRLLVAQALEEGYSIISPDHHFPDYGVPVIW